LAKPLPCAAPSPELVVWAVAIATVERVKGGTMGGAELLGNCEGGTNEDNPILFMRLARIQSSLNYNSYGTHKLAPCPSKNLHGRHIHTKHRSSAHTPSTGAVHADQAQEQCTHTKHRSSAHTPSTGAAHTHQAQEQCTQTKHRSSAHTHMQN
jgi:hypothetical protein